jgi:hypothetical protein
VFDDILGAVDYEKLLFKSKIKLQFLKHYKQKIVRVGYLNYFDGVLSFNFVFQTGGMNVKIFTASYLLPIFREYDKTRIVLYNLEYDSGCFYTDVQWVGR